MKTAVHPPHQTDLQYHLCHKVLLLSPFPVHGCVRAQVENKRYGATIRQSVCLHTWASTRATPPVCTLTTCEYRHSATGILHTLKEKERKRQADQ